MKLAVQKFLHKFGYQVSRFEASPYENLKEAARYKNMSIKLLGKDFVIADAASFYWNYREIFIDNIYKFKTEKKDPVILDCGSNYGSSIVYFKEIYPGAKITGVEADPKIFELLSQNIKRQNLSGVHLINKAISNSNKDVLFYHEGADGGRISPIKTSKQSFRVPPIHLDELIDGPIDFLKMDIEGSETEVLCASRKLKDVSQLFIEYHSFVDSVQTLNLLLKKLSTTGFRYYIHTQFCSSRPLTEKVVQLGMDLQLNIFADKSAK